jgi:hypothetical protein
MEIYLCGKRIFRRNDSHKRSNPTRKLFHRREGDKDLKPHKKILCGHLQGIDGQQAGPARPDTGPGKHDPSANGPCLESPRAWPLAKARPSGPLFVPGQPARHAQKNGLCQHQPANVPKQ